MSNKRLLFPILIFLFSNVLFTYFLTTSTFNIYIIPFKREAWGEIMSVIGNLAVLSTMLIIMFSIVKKAYKRVLWMGILTIVLGILIYALRVYTRYYLSFFSFRTLSVFNNPAGSLGFSIVFEALKDYFTSFSFLLLIPGIGFIIYAIHLKKTKYEYSWNSFNKSFKIRLGFFMICAMASFLSINCFNQKAYKKWAYNSDLPLYGVQNSGVYNYYVYEMFGVDFRYNYRTYMADNEIKEKIQEFNHNSDDYLNLYNEKETGRDFGKGIFAGKNLYILQLESVNKFIIDLKVNGIEVTPNLNRLIKEDENLYYFSNMYTNAGQGNTADAELAMIAGVNANGYSTLHWDIEDNDYSFTCLPELFKEKYNNAKAYSFHGDTAAFYNRNKVHEGLFGFDEYFSKEDYLKTNPNEKQDPDNFVQGWVKDERMIEWADEILSEEELFLAFNIMTVSHTPYVGNPLEKSFNWKVDNTLLERYLSYMRYVDNYLGDFFDNIKNNTDTVYILYGDHGAGLYGNPIEEIYGEISWEKQVSLMMEVPAFIYDPSGSLNDLTDGNMKQDLVRNQIDLYSTVITLFDLRVPNIVLGVNALSNEKTFAYNPSFFCIFTDNYMYSVKDEKYYSVYWYNKTLLEKEIAKIKRYKLYVEIAICHNLF